jgi:hypothetical protein
LRFSRKAVYFVPEIRHPPKNRYLMNNHHLYLLQLDLYFSDYKFALLSFITAFVVTLIAIPPIISLVRKYRLYDLPSELNEHAEQIPTM